MEDQPSSSSIEWNDYVISQFDQKLELREGHPNVAGLRRVSEKLLGPIKQSEVINFESVGNDGRATVHYRVVFGDGTIVSDVADASPTNLEENFVPYAMATAATRAEARCLRKALKLRVCAAEEIGGPVNQYIAVVNNGENKITPDQLSFITTKCKRLNINIKKLISKRGNYSSLVTLEKDVARTLIKDLSMWSNDKGLIDSSVIGYEEILNGEN